MKSDERKLVWSHEDLDIHKLAFGAVMDIFRLTKKFLTEEKFSLSDQMRKSSRSVYSNVAKA